MKFRAQFTALLLLILAGWGTVAMGDDSQKDPRALEVLNNMAAYTASLDQFQIKGAVFRDAGLGAGLVVSNPSEVTITIDRPGSIHINSFDGVNTREIYIHKGQLTMFSTETGFYARAQVPEGIEDAMQFAIEEFELDLPLAEFVFADSALALMKAQDELIYLTDKSRIQGVDCHQLAIRGSEVDLQLWVEEGARPAPRRILMTMKWEGGSPRNEAMLEFSALDELDAETFEFEAPEGAYEIQFVGSE